MNLYEHAFLAQESNNSQKLDFNMVTINLVCSRCLNPTKQAISTAQIAEANSSESKLALEVGRVHCLTCNMCVGINLCGNWVSLERALTSTDDTTKCGWMKASTDMDRKIHYVLSQICYRELETPTSEQQEAVFDIPDAKDLIKILWNNKDAIGFYTIKLKGTLVDELMDCYRMHTLDTAYIRNKHRRNGYGKGILSDLVATFPNEDIGFSTPISNKMLRVIKLFLTENSSYRNRFWELNGTGGEGNQKIIWYSFNRS